VTGRSFELGFGTCRKTKPTASVKRETIIPIVLVKRSSHRLIWSSQMVATKMNRVFEDPTATIAPRTPAYPEIPASLNTTGSMYTLASMPEACWEKLMPRARMSIQCTGGIRHRSSCYTPPSKLLEP
jgi:hypothetical protein